MDEILASIRRIIADDEQASTRSAIAWTTGSTLGPDEDVLELTQAINEDGSLRHLGPTGPSPSTATNHGGQEPAAQAGINEERLVSDPAARATAGSLARLSSMLRQPEPDATTLPVRPLDDIVRDLLQPLLRTWLDDHLPEIVERLVQAEIARISGRQDPSMHPAAR